MICNNQTTMTTMMKKKKMGKKPSSMLSIIILYYWSHSQQYLTSFVAAQSDGVWNDSSNNNENTNSNPFGRDDTSPEVAKKILLDLYSATGGLDWNDWSRHWRHLTCESSPRHYRHQNSRPGH